MTRTESAESQKGGDLKPVILVDDGLATGASMRAAIEALRQHRPGRMVVAVPVAPQSTCQELAEIVDEVVCATTPSPFLAVGRIGTSPRPPTRKCTTCCVPPQPR